MRKIGTIDAIRSLIPDSQVVVNGSGEDETIEWHNPKTAPITSQQIEDEIKRLTSLPEKKPSNAQDFMDELKRLSDRIDKLEGKK